MDGTGPIFILVFILFTTLLIIYALARQRKREYSSGKRKYQALTNSFHRLNENVLIEADRWPIYARPVMFTEIDHDTQIEFAKAQKAITDAHKIIPKIETINEPETPEKFRLEYLFKIFTNLNSILSGGQLILSVNAFEQKIVDINRSITSLGKNRNDVEKKKKKVETSIQHLKQRIEQSHKKIKPGNIWKAIESNNLTWTIGIAESCHSEAETRISNVTEEELGYLQHAIADVFVDVGNFSLDCIDIFLESQAISGRYILDEFNQLFNESITFFQSIISMEGDWNGWRKLKRAKEYISKFPHTKKLAERSLYIFRHQQLALEKLIVLVNAINLAIEIEKVDALEKDCTYYWYSYDERKTFWEKALGNPPRFPSVELNRFQTLLVADIHPQIAADMFVEQSKTLILIRKINQALDWHNFIMYLTSKLGKELNIHKEAQKEVEKLLSSQGKATIILADLKLVIKDTSPDFSDKGNLLVRDHQSYLQKAIKVSGANFPELKNYLNIFITKSKELVDEHKTQMEKLVAEYTIRDQRIKVLLEEIHKYIVYEPHFDQEAIRIFNVIFKRGVELLNEEITETYSQLGKTTKRMEIWLQGTEPLADQAREKYTGFLKAKRQAHDQFQNSKLELQTQRALAEKSWGWLRNELIPLINRHEQFLLLDMKEYDRSEERRWAELTIHKATMRCETLMKSTIKILDDLTQQTEKLRQKQSVLNGKSVDIDRLARTNAYRLNQKTRDEIKALVKIAKQAENYEIADRILHLANKLAIKRVNADDYNEIQKVINVYSGGGPVFMNKVTNTGSISGRADKRITYRTKRS